MSIRSDFELDATPALDAVEQVRSTLQAALEDVASTFADALISAMDSVSAAAQVTVAVDTDSAQASLDDLGTEAADLAPTVEVTADTAAAAADIADVAADAEGAGVVVPVEADTASLAGDVIDAVDAIAPPDVVATATVDVGEAQEALDDLSGERTAELVASADVEAAEAALEGLHDLAAGESTTIPVDADISAAAESIDDLVSEERTAEITVGADVADAVDAVADAAAEMVATEVIVPVEADVEPFTDSVDATVDEERAATIVVEADVDSAEDAIGDVRAGAEETPAVLPVEADIEAAASEIEGLLVPPGPIVVPVEADTDAALSEIEGLIGDLTATVVVDADVSAIEPAIEEAIGAVDGTAPIEPDVSAIGPAIDEAVSGADTTAIIDVDVGDAATQVQSLGGSAEDATGSVADLAQAAGSVSIATGLARGNVSSLEATIAKIGPGFGGAAAGVAALAVFVGELVQQDVQAERAQIRFNQALGASAEAVNLIDVGGLSGTIQELSIRVGATDEQLQLAAARIADLGRSSGASEKQIAGTSEAILALALHLQATNPALGDAGQIAEGLTNAFARGGRALARYGISLSTAEITQRAFNETGKTVASDLSIFEKSAAGAAIRIEQLGSALGTQFEAGARTSAVQFEALKTQLEETLEALGRPLTAPVLALLQASLPVAISIAEVLAQLSEIILPVLPPVFKAVGTAVGVVTTVLGDLLGIVGAIPTPVLAISAALAIAVPLFDAAVIGLANMAVAAESAALATGPIGALGIALGILAAIVLPDDWATILFGAAAAATAAGIALVSASGAALTFGTVFAAATGPIGLTVAAVAALTTAFLVFRDGGRDAAAEAKAAQEALFGTSESVEELSSNLTAFGTRFADYIDEVADFGEETNELQKAQKTLGLSNKDLLAALTGTDVQFEAYTKTLLSTIDTTDLMGATSSDLSDELKQERENIQQAALAQVDLLAITGKVTAAEYSHALSVNTTSDGVTHYIDALKDLTLTAQIHEAEELKQQEILQESGAAWLALREAVLAGTEIDLGTWVARTGAELKDVQKFIQDTEAEIGKFVDDAVSKLPTVENAFTSWQESIKESTQQAGEDVKSGAITFQEGIDQMVAAADPQRLVDQIQETIANITSFQANLQTLVTEGFGNVVEFLVSQGPVAGGALAASLVDDAAVADRLNDVLPAMDTAYADYASFADTVGRERLSVAGAGAAGGMVEGFSAALNLTAPTDAQMQAAVEAVRRGNPNVTEAAASTAIDADRAFAERFRPAEQAGQGMSEVPGAISGQSVFVEGAAFNAADSMTARFGEGVDFEGRLGPSIVGLTRAIEGLGALIAPDSKTSGETIGASFGDGIIAGIGQKFQGVELTARDVVRRANVAAAKEAQAESPSKVWVGLGEDMVAGLVIGLEDTREVQVAAAEVAAAATPKFDFGIDPLAGLGSTITSSLNTIAADARGAADDASSVTRSFGSLVTPTAVTAGSFVSLASSQAKAAVASDLVGSSAARAVIELEKVPPVVAEVVTSFDTMTVAAEKSTASILTQSAEIALNAGRLGNAAVPHLDAAELEGVLGVWKQKLADSLDPTKEEARTTEGEIEGLRARIAETEFLIAVARQQGTEAVNAQGTTFSAVIANLQATQQSFIHESALVGAHIGEGFVAGMAYGILVHTDLLEGATKAMVETAVEASREHLGIRSPSAVYQEMGEQSVEGFTVGLAPTPELAAAATGLVDRVTESLDVSGPFRSYGERIVDDYAAGLRNTLPVDAAARDLAERTSVLASAPAVATSIVPDVVVPDAQQFRSLIGPATATAGAFVTLSASQAKAATGADLVESAVTRTVESLATVPDAVGPVGEAYDTLAEQTENLSESFGGVAGAVKTATDTIGEGVDDLTPTVAKAGAELGEAFSLGLAFGVLAHADVLYDSVRAVVDTAVEEARTRSGTHSPSTVFATVGEDMVAGLAEGLADTKPVEVAAGDLADAATPPPVGAITAGSDVAGQVLGGLEDLNDQVTLVFGRVFSNIDEMLGGEVSVVAGQAQAIGTAFANSLADSVAGESFSAFADSLANIAALAEAFIDQIGHQAVHIGEAFSLGLAWGILAHLDVVDAASRAAADAAEHGLREQSRTESPSLVFAAVGEDMIDGLAGTLEESGARFEAAGREVVTSFTDGLRSGAPIDAARDLGLEVSDALAPPDQPGATSLFATPGVDVGNLVTPTKVTAGAFVTLAGSQAKAAIAADTVVSASGRAGEALDGLAPKVEAVSEAFDGLAAVAEVSGTAFVQSLADSVGGESFTVFSDAIDNIQTLLADRRTPVGVAAAGLGEAFVGGMSFGMIAHLDLIDGAAAAVGDAAVSAIKRSMGIASPSKVWQQIGLDMVDGLADGLSQTRGISTAVARIADLTTPVLPTATVARIGVATAIPTATAGGGGMGDINFTFDVHVEGTVDRETARQIGDEVAAGAMARARSEGVMIAHNLRARVRAQTT